MRQESLYYKHSGKIGPLGPILIALMGFPSVIILGLIYGYAIWYIPFVYLNFFITLGYGALIGFLIGLGAKWGKIRNTPVLLLFGLILGLLALYFAWVFWFLAASKQEFLLLSPSVLFGAVKAVAEEGAWSMFGFTPKGIFIYLIWLGEAVIIIGGSILVAFVAGGVLPFCERCNRWVTEIFSVSPLQIHPFPDDLRSQIERSDFDALKSLARLNHVAKDYLKIDLVCCKSCQNMFLMSLTAVKVGFDKDGKEDNQETPIMERFIIDGSTYEMLKDNWPAPGIA